MNNVAIKSAKVADKLYWYRMLFKQVKKWYSELKSRILNASPHSDEL